jgi:hypothetical protein
MITPPVNTVVSETPSINNPPFGADFSGHSEKNISVFHRKSPFMFLRPFLRENYKKIQIFHTLPTFSNACFGAKIITERTILGNAEMVKDGYKFYL